MKKYDKSTQLFGLSFFSKSQSELLTLLWDHLSHSSKAAYIFTPNPEQVVQATQDRAFEQVLARADFLLPDGIGLVWASRFLAWRGKAQPLSERITGVDILSQLLLMASQLEQRVLVIGGKSYHQGKQAEKMSEQPAQQLQLEIEGQTCSCFWTPGYENIAHPTTEEEHGVLQVLKQLKPDLVFVAFGAPYQEHWVASHRQVLENSKVKIVMVVGGGMDYLTGQLKRAPVWVQHLGLEWLFRLLSQPARWRRQTRLLIFLKLVLQKFFSKE